MRVLFTFLALAALPSLAQSSRMEGRVVTVDGKPVPKATVRLNGRASGPNTQPLIYVEVTSSDGRFTVENIVPGTYSINAQRTGYTNPTALALRPAPITIASGETRSNVEIKLVQLAVVSGLVMDTEGDPVQGATVRLLRPMYSQGRLMFQPATTATADDRGQFRMPNVVEGRYYLAASGGTPVYGGGVNEIRGRSALETNQTTYYPNSSTIEGAAKLDIKAASLESVQIRLRRGMSYTIKGVVEMPGDVSRSASLTVISHGADSSSANLGVAVRPNGQFETGALAPGSYTLLARFNAPPVEGRASKMLSGRTDVTIASSNVENVSIRLSDGGEVTGRVTMEDGSSLAGYRPAVSPSQGPQNNTGPRVGVMLMAAEAVLGAAQTQILEDGTFRITNVTPSKYTLMVNSLLPTTYVKSARLGGQDVMQSGIDFSSGVSGSLEIVLSTKAAKLNVAMPPALASLPQAETQEFQFVVWPVTPNRTSQTGGVIAVNLRAQQTAPPRLQGFAPGEYYAAVWEDTVPQEFARIPEFLARFNDLAAKVTLKEGDTGTVEPRVISRDALQKILNDFP